MKIGDLIAVIDIDYENKGNEKCSAFAWIRATQFRRFNSSAVEAEATRMA